MDIFVEVRNFSTASGSNHLKDGLGPLVVKCKSFKLSDIVRTLFVICN